MKRQSSSDSLSALMSIRPTSEDFESMLDEEQSHGGEKKRRLAVDQVKALEKTFEIENKLEPERKLKLAQELGLQPRQVAVWFQNRRARWKTKQLERDYGVLKANYESLKLNFDALQQNNDALLKEIKELKSKLRDEKMECDLSESENLLIEQTNNHFSGDHSDDFNYESFKSAAADDGGDEQRVEVSFPDFKDGSSDSDSSGVLNDDNSPNAVVSSAAAGILQSHHPVPSSPAASLNCFSFQKQFVKIEEYNFFSGEETCNLFSDEEAPSLPWYSPDQWN